ncbi:DEAD/DEAH box helicase, partial [bacterium]|nr:DEAD/DEAH box helicase [bacterium]
RVGPPTEVQEQSWAEIAEGRHVLLTAPTGSGKTMAAFLWSLNQFSTGRLPCGRTRVLYISPLKALNNDIQRNLIRPLQELSEYFKERGESFPAIRVQTRSGDTPESERRQMVRRPPEILITTPESLNLLLSSRNGRSMLETVATVILDEIHALIGSKRGVHLMSGVERLALSAGEFQRIALSATIKPIEAVVDFVAGYTLMGDQAAPHYRKREIAVVQTQASKQYALTIISPDRSEQGVIDQSIWSALVAQIMAIIERHRSTLIFTNSRRLCEKITNMINESVGELVAYAHHGSLSREVRFEVEQRLKRGELKAIVATNSLELGIDIGPLEQVVLVQSPNTISSAIQRIGRAGHQVGAVSSGTLFPTHAQDLLEATVLARAIVEQDIEPVRPVKNSLDVLSQVIISMLGVSDWDIDELYHVLRCCYSFHELDWSQYELVLEMLAGRYAQTRIRELRPKVTLDRLENRVRLKKGALFDLYLSGGTIPDRGYFKLRLEKDKTLLGELDEEFVWEAAIGQTFTLGTQNWQIVRMTPNEVFVHPAAADKLATPFWKADGFSRDYHYSERIGQFLEHMENKLGQGDPITELTDRYNLQTGPAQQLIDFLSSQREYTNAALPHRHHIVLEYVQTGPQQGPGNQLIIHTFWGSTLNQPYALALTAAWEQKFHHQPELYSTNDNIVLQLPHAISGEELLALVTCANLETLLRHKLESSGFFGARFRENAGRALLLTRTKFHERMPLWLTRLRSQKLLDAVRHFPDFPIVLETWRTCIWDEFDLVQLKQVLNELEIGSIAWSECHTFQLSPMARATAWRQTNYYMYLDDTPKNSGTSRLSSSLIQDIMTSPHLRQAFKNEIVSEFVAKRQRTFPGYLPDQADDVLDLVKERVMVSLDEWHVLEQGLLHSYPDQAGALIAQVQSKLEFVQSGAGKQIVVVAHEHADQVKILLEIPITAWSNQTTSSTPDTLGSPVLAATLLLEWLSFYGPLTVSEITCKTGLSPDLISRLIADLVETDGVLVGQFIQGSDQEYVCETKNYEILLRLSRAAARPVVQTRGLEWLAPFLASYQHLNLDNPQRENLEQCLEKLVCYPLPASLWETDILPARLNGYRPEWLDLLLKQSDLRWLGSEKERILFCFENELDLLSADDVDLLHTLSSESEQNGEAEIVTSPTARDHDNLIETLFRDPLARYDFSSLLRLSTLSPAELNEQLWAAVWAGALTSDSFASLRTALTCRFKIPDIVAGPEMQATRRRGHGTRFARWRGALPTTGSWFKLPCQTYKYDPLEQQEIIKERCKIVLDRYGIVFRELLTREMPLFNWSALVRTLRLLEWSGEVVTGHFFDGIPGLQFMSLKAFRLFQRHEHEYDRKLFWCNALDPISLCGTGLYALKHRLPQRNRRNHLVYRGPDLVFISENMGKNLTISVLPDDTELILILAPLRAMLERSFQPIRKIVVETINGRPAAQSPYLDIFRTAFDLSIDFKKIILHQHRDRLT